MTDHFRGIYASNAAQYEALIACEDYMGNILPTIESIHPLDGLDVVEFGAGTGRLTRLMAPHVKAIHAYDSAPHMLEKAREILEAMGAENWTLEQANNDALPAPDDSADLAIEGWSFGHAVGWYPETWREEVSQMLAEMARVLRPGGTGIVIETLGTGNETPQPPTPELAVFYRWLEEEQGFSNHTWIRTDYQFSTVPEAEELTRFFFGDALADRILAEQLLILPECTGFWWKTF